MIKPRIAVFFVLALACVGTLSAKGGAGGLFFGFDEPAWNPSFMPESSVPCQLYYFGGEGYGVDKDGMISGGFAMELSSVFSDQTGVTTQDAAAFGAVGGAIVGQRLVSEPGLHVDLAARVGVGFFGEDTYTTDAYGYAYYDTADTNVYFVGYFEPYIELGVRVFPWMRLSAALGYKYMPNLSPGTPFEDFWLNCPTLCFKASFGKF
jgi:hypothetical protein